MHLHDRWRQIIDNLASDKVTTVEELSERLSVSSATIRRDLTELDNLGRLRRIRGGALSADAHDIRTQRSPRLKGQEPFSQTSIPNAAIKRAIGKRASTLVTRGDSIIIDGGTTTFMMADVLPDEPYHVLTTSLLILNRLTPKSNVRITLPGGEVFREQSIILNPYEDEILENFSASKIFIGAQSISRRGLQQTDPLLVQTERSLIDRADQIVVLADSSKMDAGASMSVCALNDIDILITDDNIQARHREMLAAAQIELVVVNASEG
jgi:DeoR family transcriptional regulator, ulaG and ulaABCDEF operon transcriptional repressor